MRNRLVCFSLSLAFALAALVVQFAPPQAVAQQSSPGHPTPACEECAQDCRIAFEACKAAGTAFGVCAREQQKCGAACRARGGACNPQTDPPAGERR
jgi:hypothetical protein